MFANLPRKLSVPFGLLGDEAKLSFRSQPGGIAQLASIRNIPRGDPYWDQYAVLFDSASDVFSLISPHDVRRALLEAPENVATLVRVLTSRLFALVSDHTFPSGGGTGGSSAARSVTAYASALIRSGTGGYVAGGGARTKEALNCLRVLQRVLPVLFEVEGERSALELELFWKEEEEAEAEGEVTAASQQQRLQHSSNVLGRGDTRHALPVGETPQFVIEDDDEGSEHEQEHEHEHDERDGHARQQQQREVPEVAAVAQSPPQSTKTNVPRRKRLPPLGERLFTCLIDLLFCCGFTLPIEIQVDHYKINHVIWEKGIGSTTDPGPSHAYDSNRCEVLRLLLVLLSRQIYVPPSSLFAKPSLYTLHLVQQRPRRDVLTLLCSLLNTAMNSGRPSATTTIGGMAGKLPYNHLVFKGEDTRSTLVGICLQVLCVLLDFQSGSARDAVVAAATAATASSSSSGGGSAEGQTSAPTAKTNSFRYFLMKLHRTQDFAFILEGVLGILEQQTQTQHNLLPGARKSIPYTVENIIFFWKAIELNKKFRAYVLESDKAVDLLAHLLGYALEIKDKPQQHGLCRALSYIIQTLSAERRFGAKLSLPVKVSLPTKWSATGTAADFMINAVYAIVATTSGALNSLYPALIIALANAAPYFKNLSVTSTARLIQLFTSFSNPLFLLSDEGHPRLLFFMLEIFNSAVQHHLSENPNLIYGILAAHKTFEDLGTFTLSAGLREVRRMQKAKEDQSQDTLNAKSSLRSTEEDVDGETQGEKPRVSDRRHAADVDLEKGLGVAVQAENARARPQVADSVAVALSPQGDPLNVSAVDTATAAWSEIATAAAPVSVKARGKMRARRSTSIDMTANIDGIAAAGIGRNGFVPTEEWVASWQQGLPLDTVMLLISELLPKVQELQATRHKPNPSPAVMDFLGNVTLRHVLPPVPPLNPRRFVWSDASLVWLTSLIWGEIYLRGMTPLAIWNTTNVRLFYVKHTQVQQRQITETVTNVVGGFLGRTGSSDSPSSWQRPERRG